MIYLILIELEQPSPIKFNKKFIVMVVCALSVLKKNNFRYKSSMAYDYTLPNEQLGPTRHGPI
jgi:hypothetical protein